MNWFSTLSLVCQYFLVSPQLQLQFVSIEESHGVHYWNKPCHQVQYFFPSYLSTMLCIQLSLSPATFLVNINATKYLAHLIVTRGMHIYIWFGSINQYHLSIYKDLKAIKTTKKGLINNYYQNMISSVSLLHDKSSEYVESNIQHNSRGMSSSNITALSDASYFRTRCITSPDSNQKSCQKGSIFLLVITTHISWWLPMRHALQ